MSEEEITQNLTLLEYYKEQLRSIEMQAQMLQGALADYNKAKITVENLKKAEKEDEVIFPLGGGTFINGKVVDNSKVLVDIGAGIVTEKSLDEGINKLEERIKQLQENQEKIYNLGQKLQSEASELSQKTQKMINDSQD